MNANSPHYPALSTDLSVHRKSSDQSLILVGTASDDYRWMYNLTEHAAQVLWYKLIQLLYPEKASMVTGLASTARLREYINVAITTYINVTREDEVYVLEGRFQLKTWRIRLVESELRQLWAVLDLALYPVGWEGRQTKVKKPN